MFWIVSYPVQIQERTILDKELITETLVAKTSALTESDFIFRMLYKGVYWLLSINLWLNGCGLSTSDKDYDNDDDDDDDDDTESNSSKRLL